MDRAMAALSTGWQNAPKPQKRCNSRRLRHDDDDDDDNNNNDNDDGAI
jgi:hypothetical protein